MASYIVLEYYKDSYPALAEGLMVETLKRGMLLEMYLGEKWFQCLQ